VVVVVVVATVVVVAVVVASVLVVSVVDVSVVVVSVVDVSVVDVPGPESWRAPTATPTTPPRSATKTNSTTTSFFI
jgi:hypothetical protein